MNISRLRVSGWINLSISKLANAGNWLNDVSMVGQHQRCWASIGTGLDQDIMSACYGANC